MKSFSRYFFILAVCLMSLSTWAKADLVATGIDVKRVREDQVVVKMQLVLDSLRLGRNQQLYVTPVLTAMTDQAPEVVLPTVLINGRNMHYVYERNGRPSSNYEIEMEHRHRNGEAKTLNYSQLIPLDDWMLDDDVVLRLTIDTCGCGRPQGRDVLAQELNLDPATRMLTMPYPVPVVGDEKIFEHHGRARVQFEVDRTELHAEPYRCKRDGKILDNREQLAIIEDSLHYALNTPRVELHSLTICGYASPESPYLHNVELASGRSKALLEYIEDKFHLPVDRCTYDFVPENWGEFRDMVTDPSTAGVTDKQRLDLLELIDRHASLPEEFDAKETELKTSPKFRKLYRDLILPEWFPLLRCTEFTIRTHLRPMSDEELREVLFTEPELLSLNQIYRVALLSEHGSEEFHKVMEIALKYYPDDALANTNAAALAVEERRYDDAAEYLNKAGNGLDACILRGIVAAHIGQYRLARRWFEKAITRPEAQQNLKLIEDYE